jgi:hypothetical protein
MPRPTELSPSFFFVARRNARRPTKGKRHLPGEAGRRPLGDAHPSRSMAHLVTESTLNTSQPHDTLVPAATNAEAIGDYDADLHVQYHYFTTSFAMPHAIRLSRLVLCETSNATHSSPCAVQRGKSVKIGASFEGGQSDTSHGGRHGVGPGTHHPAPSDNDGYVKLDARRAQNDVRCASNDGAEQ